MRIYSLIVVFLTIPKLLATPCYVDEFREAYTTKATTTIGDLEKLSQAISRIPLIPNSETKLIEIENAVSSPYTDPTVRHNLTPVITDVRVQLRVNAFRFMPTMIPGDDAQREIVKALFGRLISLSGRVLEIQGDDRNGIITYSGSGCLNSNGTLLTCAHLFKNTGDNKRYYFARSVDLNADGVVTARSRLLRIIGFKRTLSAEGFSDIATVRPTWSSGNDLLIAQLDIDVQTPLRLDFRGIHFSKSSDDHGLPLGSIMPYFYMGYPELVTQYGFSNPLRVTHDRGVLTMEMHRLYHKVAASPGMSGGAFYTVHANAIHILGVCSGNEDGIHAKDREIASALR